MNDYFKANSEMWAGMPFCSAGDDMALELAFKQVFENLRGYVDGKESEDEMFTALNNLEALAGHRSFVMKFAENFRTLVHFDPDERAFYGHKFINDVQARLMQKA